MNNKVQFWQVWSSKYLKWQIKTLYEDDVIISTKCEQLLSVKIDSKLNFDTHLNGGHTKAEQNISVLFKNLTWLFRCCKTKHIWYLPVIRIVHPSLLPQKEKKERETGLCSTSGNWFIYNI